MNKRIYYNDSFIEFTDDTTQSAHNQQIVNGISSYDEIEKVVKSLLNNKNQTASLQNFDVLINHFKKYHYFIIAAGGLIKNQNKYLFIKRLGKWDLPKGKLETNEGPEEGAIRECEEECGVKDLTIIKELPSTFHIYEYKKSYALKESKWYLMETNYSKTLTPQTEENITEVNWFSLNVLREKILSNTYATINELVTKTLY
ncbi:MAG: NUDIX hydrolase [Bacteroidota bacterium]|jgi:ADP-ribose pyrophosphatase YjhB (NUDIX family)